MEMPKVFLFASLTVLVLALLIQAQDQSGFISLDCGLPASSTYTEQTTTLNYISDAKFIDTGVSNTLPNSLRAIYQQQLWYVRSFPQGTRNCYRIKVTNGTKYFIRATFLYGNYDGLNQLPEFDLHLGANWWDTVQITNATVYKASELVHIPPVNYIQICLANTGNGVPFISAIELRPLPKDTYVTPFGSLSSFMRLDLGSITNLTYRFNYDVYDRLWGPNAFIKEWTHISASISTGSLAQNTFAPAEVVMSTAATPVNASAPMRIWWQSANPTDQFHVFLHFAELEVLAANETRAFNITLNGRLQFESYLPQYLSTSTLYTTTPATGEKIEFLFVRTENSTHPPILNAMEVYKVKDLKQSDTDQEDVDAIASIKSTYQITRNWQGDPCGPVGYLWRGLNCTNDGDNPPRITTLDLSSSELSGEIDLSISKLTRLEKLDLSNNGFAGQVPDFLSQLQFLRILNLENNNLTGSLPSELVDKSKRGTLSLSVGQNPYLCESVPCNNNNNKKNSVVIPVIASVGGVLILLIVVAVVFWSLKRRKPKWTEPKPMSVVMNPSDPSLRAKKRQYSYSDVCKMTNNFDRVLGKGGFGTVFLGYIENTQVAVAVKMLSPSSVQGYQQFQAEVKLLMRVHHRNLTSLIGYCDEETNKGLIYEYMAQGNLNEHLSGKDSKAKFFTWEDRLRIAVDAAQGLEYLHNGCKPPIIHRDIKSTNILLSEKWQAKLSDFGLSKIIPTDGGTHVSTVVAGTPGYLDPEYSISNRLTEKSDVYSFGVVILEIITSQPVIGRNRGDNNTHISQWVNSFVSQGDVKSIVDSRLHENFDTGSAWKAVEIAMACVSMNSMRRPTMNVVLAELKECLAKEIARTNYSSANTGDSIEGMSVNLTTEFIPLAR